MRLARALCPAVLALLMGCSTMEPKDFAGREPELVLEEYFAGRTRAWGIFQDRFGNLRRQFTVDIKGSWRNGELTLVEDFVYADGETDRRVWRIRKLDAHRYEGRADDVIGTAAGEAYGNAVNWRYALVLDFGGQSWTVRFDDWMFLQPDGVLINRATVSKLGITLGQVTLVFRKNGPAADAAHTPAPEGPS